MVGLPWADQSQLDIMTAMDEIKSILLLCGEVEAGHLGKMLLQHNPTLAIHPVTTRAELDEACAGDLSATRLISFCTSIIVPAACLDALGYGAYNFHPGPPTYPGRFPSIFALYDDASQFGVTAHAMAARVDEGPIVAAEWFPIPPDCDLQTLDTLCFTELVKMFFALAEHLACRTEPLRTRMIRWSGRKTRKADCDALCTIETGLDETEIARRKRACGPHFKITY